MSDPHGFLKYSRQESKYRPAIERAQDFKEIYEVVPPETVTQQATRCMDCGVPFCQSNYGCPVENHIPEWNNLVARGMWREALEILHSTNNFPEFTGRLCPAPCESACVLGVNSSAVTIRSIEWQIIETGFASGWISPQPSRTRTHKKIAIVGSGPAGLAAAQQLARLGHEITVFEKAQYAGGLLRYGIPDFKFEKMQVERRIEQLRAEGVVFKFSHALGENIFLADLEKQFDAVALTIGAERPRDLSVEGRDLNGIHFAMDYLTQQNRLVSGELKDLSITAEKKHVVVIGGGDTGSDCVGTAHRQGALSVTQIEILPQPSVNRSGETPWPLWPLQLRTSHAHLEGGERKWSLVTQKFFGEDQKVKGLLLGPIEWQGQGYVRSAEPSFELKADLVILAMGFLGPKIETETGGLTHESQSRARTIWGDLPIQTDSRGCVVTNSAYQSHVPKIFAAGDVRRGASLIVWAIAEGRKMATSIDSFLRK